MSSIVNYLDIILYYNKTFNQVLKKERRYLVSLFLNISFSLLSSYVLYFTFSKFMEMQYQYLTIYFMIPFCITVFSEFFNITNSNMVTNLFSQKAVEIFPVSQSKLFITIFFNNCINARIILYAVPLIVVLYYALSFNPAAIPSIIILFLLFYFLVSFLYSGIDYLYGLIKYHVGELIEKLIMFAILLFVISYYFIGKNMNIPRYTNNYIYEILKYIIFRNV